MKKILPFGIAIFLTGVFFWQFFAKGLLPIPANFMAAWYEPWKTEFSANGVPTIPHKAVADDVFRQIYPFRDLAASQIRGGIAPLWNPYNGSGQPLLATLHTGISNPFSLLEIGNSPVGWSWFVMLQLPLLFLATYWYLRTLKISPLGASVSGVIMCLSGVAAARYMYGDYMYALIGLPILLGSMERRKPWLLPPVIAGILVSVQPQISVYILLTAAAYLVLRIPEKKASYVWSVVLGAGISAFQMLPTLELYRQANVTAGSSSFIFEKFLMPIPHLFSLLIPNYFGNAGTYNFWGKTDYIETVVSIGMIPVFLALHAKKGTIRSFFVWGIGISILLTLDWFGPRMLYRLPLPVLSTSIPTRIYLLTTFFIAVLAGIGIEEKPKKGLIVLLAGIGVGIALLSRTFSCPSQIPACIGIALRNSVLELGVFALGMAFLFVPRIGKAAVLFVLVATGLYNAWKILPMSPSNYVGLSHPVIEVMRSFAPARVAGIGDSAFATDFGTMYRYFDTNYYDPLYIKRYGELASYANTGSRVKGLSRSDSTIVSAPSVSDAVSERRSRFYDMTGTVALIVKKDNALLVAGDAVWSDAHWAVYRRITALPRAYLVSRVRVVPNPDAELNALFDPQTDLRTSAFTEIPVPGLPSNVVATGSADIVSYVPSRVGIDTRAQQPSFLVLSDTFDPGWTATIDGKRVPLYRTNYAFRGVAVPAGEHRVIMTYTPISWIVGLWISALSGLLWIILYFTPLRKR